MKLVVAIVQDYDCDRLLRTVTGAGFGATKISSTGGFLRQGNTTILMGVADEAVPKCLALIGQSCELRVEVQVDPGISEFVEWFPSGVQEVTVGGAIVFVARVSAYHRVCAAGIVASRKA